MHVRGWGWRDHLSGITTITKTTVMCTTRVECTVNEVHGTRSLELHMYQYFEL